MTDILSDLDSTLTFYGFRRAASEDRSSYRYHEKYWSRVRGWKTDYFRFLYPVAQSTNILMSRILCINVPGHDREGSWLEAQGFLNEWIPSDLYLALFASRFRKKVRRQVLNTLPWFDHYSTPAKCLEELNGGKTNHGDTRGPTVLAVEKRLKELIRSETEAAF